MGFSHKKVSVIEEETKAWLAQNATHINTINADDPVIRSIDGIPATSKLVQFCEEIRKVNRYVKFGIGGRSSWQWQYARHVSTELHVYMEGHTYALMRVGFGDYSVRSSDGYKFMVASRVIANDKFNGDRDQYHMATSEALDRAIKNVKKYMRPYSPVEVAGLSFDSIRSKFLDLGYSASSELVNAKDGVLNSKSIRTELFHMLDLGYEFLSQEFRNKIVVWREKYNEEQVTRGRALHAYYVHVRIDRDVMVCDVIEVLDVNKRHIIDPTATVVTYRMDELPEHVAGSLAALSMVEDDHYVDGVGLRVDGSTFWVQR